MFCTHVNKRKKERKEERVIQLWLSTQRHSSDSRTLSSRMSHCGLSRIYSSAAKFMIIVTSPWQFALCPSRQSSCYPSAILCSMPCFRAKAKICREGKFPKTKTTCHPGKKFFKKERECPRGENDFAEQKARGKQL